jgi:hypothetical protein
MVPFDFPTKILYAFLVSLWFSRAFCCRYLLMYSVFCHISLQSTFLTSGQYSKLTPQTRSWCIIFNYNSFWLRRTFKTAHSKAKLKTYGDRPSETAPNTNLLHYRSRLAVNLKCGRFLHG